jgi:predicted permease
VRPYANVTLLEGQLQVELRHWLASHEGEMTSKERAVQQTQTLHLTPGGAGVSLLAANYKESLWLLVFAAACVLLVAAANIANLMLARALKDRPQAALRAALGAGRARLVWKALCESLTIALAGAVVGIAVAYGGAGLLLRLAFAPDAWVPVSAAPSTPALLFALAVSVFTAVLCGIAPAWMASRADPVDGLRGTGRHTGHHRQWAQKTLVIAQVAMSVVLLSLAAMLGQSLQNLQQKNFGFETRDRYLVYVNAKLVGYPQEQLVALFHQIEDRLRAIPGVRNVSGALYAPMSGYYWGREIQISGKRDQDATSSAWTRVTPAFFETLGNTIVRGRPINEADSANSQPVAVVNQAFARKYFGSENPLGQRFGPSPHANLYEVVGVASDMRYFADAWEPIPMYFVPHAQTTHFDNPSLETREIWSQYFNTIVVWAPGAPPHLEEQLTRAIANFGIAVYIAQPYADVIRVRYAEQNMVASVAWLFGSVGLLLAAVGLYGVAAYGVEQRRREIGVRTALGADSRSVVAMVLRGTLTQLGIGLALGIPAAIGIGHWVASQVYGVSPWNPTMLAAEVIVLGVAASIAAAVPARRAAGVDPLEALRSE